MSPLPSVGVDDFPCGCIIVDPSRRIAFANKYLSDQFDWDTNKAVGQRLETIMSRGSHLFCDSYVYPLLFEKGKCLEVQLTFLTRHGDRMPVIVNAEMRADGSAAWSFACAENRDKLFQELVEARNKLEEQSRLLQIRSTTDELTGLMNRRAFDIIAEDVFTNKVKHGDQISLVLFDIDNFKTVNDTFGHSFGDNVLREVGICLKENCRATEPIARFGGEEFVSILIDADSAGAATFADRIHKVLNETLKFEIPITVSIGVATCFGHSGTLYKDLLNLADKAMYEAKDMGKNCTVVSDTSSTLGMSSH